MFFVIAIAVFLIALQHRGTIGPFRWLGNPVAAGPQPTAIDSAEGVLARRLADGDLSPDEYLERAALLNDR